MILVAVAIQHKNGNVSVYVFVKTTFFIEIYVHHFNIFPSNCLIDYKINFECVGIRIKTIFAQKPKIARNISKFGCQIIFGA